jgi:hypothetical protein
MWRAVRADSSGTLRREVVASSNPSYEAPAPELERVVDRLERARRTAQLPGSSDRRKAAQAIARRETAVVRARLEQLLASCVGERLEPGDRQRDAAEWLVDVLGIDAARSATNDSRPAPGRRLLPRGIPYAICVCGRVFERHGKRKWCSAECRRVNTAPSGHTVEVLVACAGCASATPAVAGGTAYCAACLHEREAR